MLHQYNGLTFTFTSNYSSQHCSNRVGWWISEHSASMVIWKLLGIQIAVQKDFYEKWLLWRINDLQKWPKNWENAFFSSMSKNWKKFQNLDPHYFSILEGVILLQLFPIPASFWDMRFLGQNLSSIIMSFEKNPFAQYFLYLKGLIWHRKHYVLRFINQP